jgi:hypothetical protein
LPTHRCFQNYGARGIEFRFTSFAQWFAELGPRPEGKDAKGRALYSVDRINNDGHYEVGNVRWATALEQVHNSRQCRDAYKRRAERAGKENCELLVEYAQAVIAASA